MRRDRNASAFELPPARYVMLSTHLPDAAPETYHVRSPGDPATMPLEAAAPNPPPLIERPRTIAYYASVSKDGRNTLRDQMGLTMEEFDDFVVQPPSRPTFSTRTEGGA